ncbi:hypothetical protein SAY86_016005 [Trapa natans]|uniref:Fungal lipase-type domain-containing protein n=1 Tax=Trapa natans TaxID=22666 RepID=A0AAN7L5I8_TRANT|nr:hypothetical protein SAY86_016005 [Trapa natans]
MAASLPAIHIPIPIARSSSGKNRAAIIRCNQSKIKTNAAMSVHLHLRIERPYRSETVISTSSLSSSWNLVEREEEEKRVGGPSKSTPEKEVIGSKWREIHGSMEWAGLLDPLHPWLRQEIIKYGEFAQATYDAFDFDHLSDYCGSCKYSKHRLLSSLGLSRTGYEVTGYIYAMSHVDVPRWLERPSHVAKLDRWCKDSNWIGFVALSDDEETRRIGRRDVVVAWRGTVAPLEWYNDIQGRMEPLEGADVTAGVRVEHGFLSVYTSKSESTRYNKFSASEQAMREIKRLVEVYRNRGEEVSLTITGHSLGGALALLNAHEAARTFPTGEVNVSVVSFAAPRAGNTAFGIDLRRLGVRVLRVVLEQDVVPRMPGLVLNKERLEKIKGELRCVYSHAGKELRLDAAASPYLKRGLLHPVGFHCMETYLHLVDGFHCSGSGFRADAERDLALVNKACGLLVDELRVPACWYQEANKGLVRDRNGRWVRQKRNPEDVPSLDGTYH